MSILQATPHVYLFINIDISHFSKVFITIKNGLRQYASPNVSFSYLESLGPKTTEIYYSIDGAYFHIIISLLAVSTTCCIKTANQL